MMGQGWMGCKKKVEYQLEKFMEKNRDNINMTLSLLIKIQTDPNRSKPTLQIENVNFEHFFNRPLLYYPTLLKLFGSSSCPLQL